MAPTDAIPNLPVSPAPQTPPSSPDLRPHKRALDPAQVQLFADLLKAVQAIQSAPAAAGADQPAKTEEPSNDESVSRERGSKLEVKSVVEVWDSKIHRYRLEEPSPADDVSELDEYVFIVRIRINKDTQNQIYYIDINSNDLREILRTVFSDIKSANLRQDKPSIERDLLYQYLPELEYCLAKPTSYDSTTIDKLQVLIRYISESYTATGQRLIPLLEHGEIDYDLLPFLFKPNDPVYTTCFGTEKPRCVKYDAGEEKTKPSGEKYYRLNCRYFDFDGKIVGEVSTSIDIPKFRGCVRINTLKAFPLSYHSSSSRIRAELIDCGRRFLSLRGMHHRHCCGNAFFMNKDQTVKVSVDSRVMVDAAFFREMNPNYTRPKVDGSSSVISCIDFFGCSSTSIESTEKVRCADLESNELEPADLLFCCPTVPGFSFTDKLWLEFAVADIKPISWSSDPFGCLEIPSQYKEIILALVSTRMNRDDKVFDDFVTGKGRGMNVLLHGSPGVGKTLTAEAVSEHLELPFYSISAADLSLEAASLENELSQIFKIAKHCNAVLLLDESDVYVEARSLHQIQRNGLVSVFLRKLEYSQSILFLTTNRVSNFDDAIISRIHLMLRYEALSKDSKTQIWKSFLARAPAKYGPAKVNTKELDQLAARSSNGRQIKNLMASAQALARKNKSPLTFSHLETVMEMNEKFFFEFNGEEHTRSVYT